MLTFSNEASYRRFLVMADKIEADPGLLDIPLDNITRWLAQDHSAPRRLEQWRTIILDARAGAAGMIELLRILRDDSEEARHLKSFSPMAGVLSREERQKLIRSGCAFAH